MSDLINMIVNNNIENDIHTQINESAEIEFHDTFVQLGLEPENKKAFLHILLDDIIQIDISTKIESFDISDILENTYTIIDDVIDELEDKISNKNNIYMKNIKKVLKEKKINLKKNLKECNNNLNILKKAYLNKNIENYLGSTNTNNINLKNLNILHSNNNKYNYILGEFFSRCIFNRIKFEKSNIQHIDNSQENFYKPEIIESFLNSNNGENKFQLDFSRIDINFKYWVILFFLISQMFSEKSDYSKLFNPNKFKQFIEELIKQPIKKETKKKRGKNKKKRGGFSKIIGGKQNSKREQFKSLINLAKDRGRDKNRKFKDDNKKLSINSKNPRNIFNELLVSVKVDNGTLPKKSLYEIYFNTYLEKQKDLLKEDILSKNIFNQNPQVLITKIECKNPFTGEKIRLSDIFLLSGNLKNITIRESNLNIELKRTKWDIYIWLKMIITHFDETTQFIKRVKSRLILLLFYLYYIKKSIYIYYIKKLDSVFNLNINNNNNKKINTHTSNNINSNIIYNNVSVKKNIDKKKISVKKNIDKKLNSEQININKNIEKIQKKIESIKSKRVNINNDEKILILEAKLKKLIISKLGK